MASIEDVIQDFLIVECRKRNKQNAFSERYKQKAKEVSN